MRYILHVRHDGLAFIKDKEKNTQTFLFNLKNIKPHDIYFSSHIATNPTEIPTEILYSYEFDGIPTVEYIKQNYPEAFV